MAVGGDATVAMTAADASRWAAFVDRGRTAAALAYDDPRWVADRLYGMLARRPRLRLPADQVGAVADVLAELSDQVRTVAPDVFADTVRAVHGT
jgi:acyl carrier protein phosphodiesterase